MNGQEKKETGRPEPKPVLLVVEDSRPFAHVLKLSLAQYFSATAICGSAAEALDEIRRQQPDLMLLDFTLPDMDADAFIRKLQAEKLAVPDFLVITGHADERRALEMAKLGARDYLVKDAGCLERIPLVVARVLQELSTERDLRLERERSSGILELMKETVYIADANGVIQYANPQARRQFGEPQGWRCHEYVYGRADRCPWCSREAIAAGKTSCPETFSPKTGSYYEATAIPFPNPDGSFSLLNVMHNITDRKKAEQALQESLAALEEQKRSLETKNAAFKEVISAIESEKNELRDNVAANIRKLVLPAVKKLELAGAPEKPVELIKKNLENLVSSFARKASDKTINLSPRELEICNMIKEGMTTKEISSLLNISSQTVDKQRKNIRRKLGFANTDTNLTSYLRSL